MEKKMETTGIIGTIKGYIGIIGNILWLYWDNGKENGNYYLGGGFGGSGSVAWGGESCLRVLVYRV